MGEIGENIISNNSILLARNTPVALVVGAGSFLGSFLSEELLKKNIQVIGADDFGAVSRSNLEQAVKNSNFHLVSVTPGEFRIEVPRLDYIIIALEKEWKIDEILDLFKKHDSKVVFVSSIDLYDNKISQDRQWLREAEKKIAKFAQESRLNARIVRLASVYGPRMNFRTHDPMVRLIQASLLEQLQKESAALEFSSRALFVEDAVNLIVKSMLSGATAQKIFDGALLVPIKVAEIKQVLLDPVWHENRHFIPSELPPWPTPNLEKTMKYLAWEPKIGLVEGLKKTIIYFKENQVEIPKIENASSYEEKYGISAKKEHVEQDLFEEKTEREEEQPKEIPKKKFSLPGWASTKPKKFPNLFLIVALALIIYGLVWPAVSLGIGVLTFRYQLTKAAEDLQNGNFDQSLSRISQAEQGIDRAKIFLNSIAIVRKTGVLKEEFEFADQAQILAQLSTGAAKDTVLGIRSLYEGLKSVTGEQEGMPTEPFLRAQVELASADQRLSQAKAIMDREDFKSSTPKLIKDRVDSLKIRLDSYLELVQKGRAAAVVLPQVIGSEGKKSYLLVLQNNNELRPTGGFIGSFAKVEFEGGKLRKLETNDVYNIDGALKEHVEPPKEIKEDLGQKDWFLRDSNWEPDFPTAARQIEWFYNKETGERVEGVIALDISAMENLLSVIGGLDVADYNEKITADNLFEKAIAHAETDFFPGSQAKKSFLTALSNQLFNKLFFLPNQNWPGIVEALGTSLDTKHMLVYLNSPSMFSYMASQNWAGVMTRAGDVKAGELQDFLAVAEANLGANKANYYLERSYYLDTTIGKQGEVFHRLKINYTNRSPSTAFPAGVYKNRFRIYLPLGTKLTRAVWGETEITTKATPFVDYGRSGYSLLLELSPKEEKNLILDYQLPNTLNFKDGQVLYSLNVIKQAGTLKDPFEWKLTYPINYKLTTEKPGSIAPQEHNISTDLSSDRVFSITFKK